MTSGEIKFFIRTAVYILYDHKRKEEILEYLKAEPAAEKLRRCTSNWLRHVTRMNNNNRMRTAMLNYIKKWAKTTAKTFEETIEEGETGL